MPPKKKIQTTKNDTRSIKDYFKKPTNLPKETDSSKDKSSFSIIIPSISDIDGSPATRLRSRQQEEISSKKPSSSIQTRASSHPPSPTKPKTAQSKKKSPSKLTPNKPVGSMNQTDETNSKLLDSERRLTRSSTKPVEEANSPTKRSTRSSTRVSDMDASSASPAKRRVSEVAQEAKDKRQSEIATRKSSLTPLQTCSPVTRTTEININDDIIPSSPLTELDEPLETGGSKAFFPGTLPPSGPQTSQSGLSSPTSPTTPPPSVTPVMQVTAPTTSLSDDDELEDPDLLFLSRVEQNLQDSPRRTQKKTPVNSLASSKPLKKSTRIVPSRPIYNPQIHASMSVQRTSVHSLESMIKSVKAAEKRSKSFKRSHEEYLRLGCDQLEIPEELPERFSKMNDNLLKPSNGIETDEAETSLMELDDEELEEISKEDVEKIGVLPMILEDDQSHGQTKKAQNERYRKLKESLLKDVDKGKQSKKLEEDRKSRSIFVENRFSSDSIQPDLVTHQINLSLKDEVSRLHEADYDVDMMIQVEKAVLEEMIDYLNYGWTHPDAVPVDLFSFLPSSLMQPSAESPTQRLILELLFRIISNPACPVELSYKCLINFSKACEIFKVKMDKDWQSMIRSSFLSLGIKSQYLKFSTDEMEEDLSDSNTIAPLKETLHTLRSVLQVVEILLSSGCFSTDIAQRWILLIIFRLTIDPHTSELSQDLSRIILRLLSLPVSNSTATLLLENFIEIGKGLKSWKSRMEFVKRMPNELEFRKWGAMVMIDLVEENDLEMVKRSISYIVKRSRAFTVAPSARELYNLVIDGHPKYSELSMKSEEESYEASYKLRKIFQRTTEDLIEDEEMGEVIGLMRFGLHGLWDYLCDESHKKEIKIKLKDGENIKGNLWIMKLWDGLKEYETSINTMGYGDEKIQERLRLKNLVTGLMMMIKFQDEEAVQQVKNIYRDGQMKLDRFVLRK
ncbi:uncharacterized protein MELLADRAFT_91538 [Melampsora larici-populina 98AG31]|uniref:Uncharacterized protein n=1 Tax=Melampsora larici-populina (strain 98AG31 / pathotype 3-4-7) TaxID=747676 RepID=F4RZE8_MELLP|nr:uncharacterized protein MELLADRAFT_91538 [Melampsora larici-populina 98AG31]EGG02214.1 hypothetical protein MELLADRAFT_91538 [Melampsora larici-populina 98AG31]